MLVLDLLDKFSYKFELRKVCIYQKPPSENEKESESASSKPHFIISEFGLFLQGIGWFLSGLGLEFTFSGLVISDLTGIASNLFLTNF